MKTHLELPTSKKPFGATNLENPFAAQHNEDSFGAPYLENPLGDPNPTQSGRKAKLPCNKLKQKKLVLRQIGQTGMVDMRDWPNGTPYKLDVSVCANGLLPPMPYLGMRGSLAKMHFPTSSMTEIGERMCIGERSWRRVPYQSVPDQMS